MGQKSSHQRVNNLRLPFLFTNHRTTRNPFPEQPIKFQYKTKRKPDQKNTQNACKEIQTLNNLKVYPRPSYAVKNTNETRTNKLVKEKNIPIRTKSEPSLNIDRARHRHKKTRIKNGWNEDRQQFGYEIQDIDEFLAKATLKKPANIPVVLAAPSTLYQINSKGERGEVALPLGMVVNAVFRSRRWLYVQTPHAEEGYVSYSACLPLGIIPPQNDKPAPCWENSTDVFPKPSGNMTDTEKLSSKSDYGGDTYCRGRSRKAVSICEERSVDRLYLRAAAIARGKGIRQTLLVINMDFQSLEKNSISVKKGDVVFLLDARIKDWFYVKNKEGDKGFIPAAVAGHGFL